ncbi:MAG TPA: hypothetical protein VN026_18525 [Bacteroidia bacterium]|jgi:hypothetical protein|nr:hypothetical protein [Bacteroidia bacterium]
MTDKEKQVYKNLDLILAYIENNPNVSYLSIHSYCKRTIKPEPSDTTIHNYVLELRFKEYVINIHNTEYNITVKGIAFVGYEQDVINEGIEKNKAKRNEWLISRGAALAAMFSGLLFLMEILKYCSDKHDSVSYHFHFL